MVALDGGEGAVDGLVRKDLFNTRKIGPVGYIRQSIRVAFIRFGAAYPDLFPIFIS